MDNKQLFIEILKYASWPVVVVWSVFLLKDKITNILGGGIKSAKHGDTEVHFFEGKQSFKAEVPEHQNLQHLISIDPTGLREDIEERIQSQLTAIVGDHEKIDILTKNLAQQQITNAFEKVYYNIFGSQIRLLEFLSVQAGGITEAKNLIDIYEHTKKINPEVFKEY